MLFNLKTICTVDYGGKIIFLKIDSGNIICKKSGNDWINFATILKDGTLVTVGDNTMIRFWSW